MSRKPKPKNTLSAGERVALYNAQKEAEERRISERTPKPEAKSSAVPKIEKKKPQYASVKVDFAVPVGKIKPLHSMCNGPLSARSDISGLFRSLGVPYVRLHNPDTGTGQYTVNVSGIFPDANADENDERSYNFKQADRYVASVYNAGAIVIFCFGDKLPEGRESLAYTDPYKWAAVCVNIIKHYNEYWADGFAYGMKYFEICPPSAEGHSEDEVFSVYAGTVRGIRMYDSSLSVGGLSFDGDKAKAFPRFCRKNRLPLDFLSIKCYSSNPCDIKKQTDDCLYALKNNGYEDSFVVLDEWNYIPTGADGRDCKRTLDDVKGREPLLCREIAERMSGIEGASFAAAAMLELNGAEGVDLAFYYDAEPGLDAYCGICDRFGNPEKVYYAFSAYSELYRASNGILCLSEQRDDMLHSGIYAGAAISEDGVGYILVSSYDGCGMVDLRIDSIPDNLYNADVYMIDGVKNLSLCDSVPLSGMKKRLLLNISRFGIALIKLY